MFDEDEKIRFREAIDLFAGNVAVVTVGDDEPRAATASAVCSLAREPLKLVVCVDAGAPMHAALMESDRFAVNLLREGQESLARRFANGDGNRLAGLPVEERKGVPLLRDAIAHFVCRPHERFAGEDHAVFIGKVTDLGLRSKARPLLHYGDGAGADATLA